MPTYDVMKRQVENSPGIDITVADVDLLPWSHGRLNNKEYHKIQMHSAMTPRKTDQEKTRERAQAAAAKKKQDEAEQEVRRKQEEEAEAKRKTQELARLQAEEEQRRREEEEAARLAAEEEQQKRRQRAPAVTPGSTAVEKAYRWYDLLSTPTKRNMKKAIDKNLLDITNEDVETLPWNARGTNIDFPTLHDLLEKATGEVPMIKSEMIPSTPETFKAKLGNLAQVLPSTPKAFVTSPSKLSSSQPLKNLSFTPRSTKGTFSKGTFSPQSKKSQLWNALDESERLKRKAFGWYLTLQRPSQNVMEHILAVCSGIGTDQANMALLPWNEEGDFVEEARMVLPSLFGSKDEEKRKRQVARRATEDAARGEEASEWKKWKQEQPPAPDVPPSHMEGDVAHAYLWYKKLGEPTKETFKAVLQETKGVPVTMEQVDALPWTYHDLALDHDELAELLREEENTAFVAQHTAGGDGLTFDPKTVAAILKAYRAYKELDVPKYITFTSFVNNTQGLDVTEDDVSLLPWDKDRKFVDEGRIQQLVQQQKEYTAQQELLEAAKRKQAAERRQRQQLLAMKQKEEEERRSRRDEAGNGGDNQKQVHMPRHLHRRMSIREVEYQDACDKGNKTEWEESRTLKAYAWYTRMSGLNRERLKKVIASMKECDVVPEDIDLLPWSPSGGWVDHIKIDELSSRRKDVVY